MFWSQMNLVHHLPINPEIGKDESLWWTPEEKKVLELISHQISYGRFGDDVPDLPILTDELGMTKEHLDYYKYHCLSPVVLCEEGKLVLGLDPLWQNFFTKHTDIGKYCGTVDFSEEGAIVTTFTCHSCGTKWYSEFVQTHSEMDEDKLDTLIYGAHGFQDDHKMGEAERAGYQLDCGGLGFTFEGTVEQVANDKASCPQCGGDCGVMQYDDGPGIDTVWVFEKGSIAFSHYGRGAGLSFRYHKNLGNYDDELAKLMEDPVKYFRWVKAENQ